MAKRRKSWPEFSPQKSSLHRDENGDWLVLLVGDPRPAMLTLRMNTEAARELHNTLEELLHYAEREPK